MITSPNSQVEARPAPLTIKSEPHLHPAEEGSRATATPTLNFALAGLQLIAGYEWLLAGGDKLLLGSFPAQLSGLIRTSIGGGHLVGFFVAILQGFVMPNALLFGYLIELGETLAGLGLITAGLMALLRPLAGRSLSGTSAVMFVFGDRLLGRLAPIAATGAGLLGISYFFLDGLPEPWFVPSIAFGGSIDPGLFLAAVSVVLIVGQLMQQHQSR
jgi:thiosulfate dehydrogenase [quinone] large subunit